MQKALEDKGIEILNAELQRIPTSYVDVTAEQGADINKLIEKLEDDDDVTNIWHNMKEN
jgi:transcriptional/translational regulatory protein YebC/TACO1